MTTLDAQSLRRQRAGLAVMIMILALLSPLAGCGKRGDPSPPRDEPQTYPRKYPSE
ncbi:MAG TPA: hypothetical protein VET85_11665 [Stellaceae bacterium]|nr:hypothetical protein [Stellaceae bacterium]